MENFNKIYNENRDYIFKYLVSKTKDVSLSEELTNDTMMKVFNNLHKFDSEKSKLRTWITNIANNTLIDNWRKKKLDTKSIESYVDADGNEFFQVASDNTPLSEMISSQTINAIKDCINVLPKKYKQIAELYFDQQLSYEEISEDLSLPLGTVKGQISRTRAKLQNALESLRAA